MPNRILTTFMAVDFVFLCTGAFVLAASLIFMPNMADTAKDKSPASHLLLHMTPLTGGIVNAAFIFATFVLSIPGILNSNNRLYMRVHSYAVMVCAFVSLLLGLAIWFSTLKTKTNLSVAWGQRTAAEQSMLQQQFKCCGYLDPSTPPFVTDSVCKDSATALRLGGCVGPFSTFANQLLDIVFTAMFGLVAVDVILFLSAVVVIKDRAERERYRLIDQKNGIGGF